MADEEKTDLNADERVTDAPGVEETAADVTADTVAVESAQDDVAPAEALIDDPEPAVEPEPSVEPEAVEVPAAEPEPVAAPAPAPTPAPAPAAQPAPAPKAKGTTISLPICIAAAVVALVIGLLIGHFVKFGGSSLTGKTTLSEADLNAVVATYTAGGKGYDITARQVLESAGSLDAAKQADGNYTVPGASSILAFAQNAIVEREIENKGITVSDEEVAAYAEEQLGSSDYASIASTYGMSEDQIKKIMQTNAATKKLYDSIVGEVSASMPEAPTAPAEGAEDTPTAEYGAYIVKLLGDEWDSSKGTWARKDGPFYAAMGEMDFKADSATYSQAESAYYVAYQQFSQQASTQSGKWTEYVNGLMSNASIQINTLIS